MAAQGASTKVKKTKHITWEDEATVATESTTTDTDSSDDESIPELHQRDTKYDSSDDESSVASYDYESDDDDDSIIGDVGITDIELLQIHDINPQALQLFDVETVAANMKLYTPRQVKHAKRARELQVSFGATTDVMRAILQQPGEPMEENPITLEHVRLAEAIFGRDVPRIKGGTTRTQPGAVIDDSIYIPEHFYALHQEVNLEIDIMFTNGLPALTGIDTTVIYRSYVPIKKRTKAELLKSLDKILRTYNKAGYAVKRIDADGEFEPLLDDLRDSDDINVNIANPGDHVPHAERNNRTLKERVRTILHGLPFRYHPKQLLLKAGEKAAKQLNIFPAKQGLSTVYSPEAIMTRKPLKYKDWKIPFGSYVQASDETNPRNSNQERAIDCLYLMPAANMQEGHEVLHIQTGQVVKRRVIEKVPFTEAIIAAVEGRAKREGMRKSFMIQTREEYPIHRADWLPGVDHELLPERDEDSDDEDYEPEEDDSSDEELDSDDYEADESSEESDEDEEETRVFEDEN